jgi:hypothetical protein
MAGRVEGEAAVEVVDAVGLDDFIVEVFQPEVGDAIEPDLCAVWVRKGLLRVCRG